MATGEKEPKQKRQRKMEKQTQKATFPVEGTVNAYGFIHLSNGVAEEFGVQKGQKMPITINFKDSNLVISKA